MKLLYDYHNGNYDVKIFDDGTKVREFSETPIPTYPESMDLKCTDYCNAGCKFCHEMSTIDGLHGDPELAIDLMKVLPPGIEIAFGGGDPMSWDSFGYVATKLSNLGVICNVTVNSIHIRKNRDRLMDYMDSKTIRGLGISYFKALLHDCLPVTEYSNNVIFHVIMGVHTVEDLRFIISKVKNPKILLLGYKQYGRGKTYHSKTVEDNLYKWYVTLHEFFKMDNLTISFDNLGIKQMNLSRFFEPENWKTFYMGDDGQFTFFLDLVKKEYTKSSTSDMRYKIDKSDTIVSMFKRIRESI